MTTHSMTGFSVVQGVMPDHSMMTIELRSVNHRFLDLNFRLPDQIRVMEGLFREHLQKCIKRGKVDCKITFSLPHDSTPECIQLNHRLVSSLLKAADELCQNYPGLGGVRAWEILRWPGVIEDVAADQTQFQQCILERFKRAVDILQDARYREGQTTQASLLQKVTQIKSLIETLSPKLPDLFASYHQKIRTRLDELAVGGLDPQKMEQEFALFLQKSDIDEELSRLGSHLSEIQRLLTETGPKGKHLDFMMQELNREANTMASKAMALEITQTGLNLKVLIEQMREQIQNVE